MNMSKLSADWNISAIVSSNVKARGGKEEEKKIEWQHYVFRREGNTESSMIQQILQSPYFFPACHLRIGRALLQNVETICRLIHEHIPYLIDKYIKY